MIVSFPSPYIVDQKGVWRLNLTIFDPNFPIQPYSNVPPQTEAKRCNEHADCGYTPGIVIPVWRVVEHWRDTRRWFQSRRIEQSIQLFRRHVNVDNSNGRYVWIANLLAMPLLNVLILNIINYGNC